MKNFPSSGRERYIFIDALRGIAALSVLFHHLIYNTDMKPVFERTLPHFITSMAYFGALGVQIFFVLSGFVIAHSLRDNPINFQSLTNFALRRQIRLDLPYWSMLAIILLLYRVEIGPLSLSRTPAPPFGEILCNFFYLQNILGVNQIMGVAWTLCIEIQFYLAFILLLCVSKSLSRNLQRLHRESVITFLVFASGVFSLIAIQFKFYPVWFVQYWFYFAAGVLCCRSVQKTDCQWIFLVFSVILLLGTAIYFINPNNQNGAPKSGLVVGFCVVELIYLIGIKGKLSKISGGDILQHLGRISYSIYLVHLTSITIILNFGYKISGENPKAALLWMLFAFCVSIACAQLLFLAIERPSMRLASRFKIKEVEH